MQEGALQLYRLFDVADAIDLSKAEAIAAAPRSRLRLETAQGSAAFEIPAPPLHLALGERTLRLSSGPRVVQAEARLYDYGVVSVVYRLPIPPGTPLEALVPLAEELAAAPTPALDAEARREADELCRALAPTLSRPHAWDGLETYHVFFVRRFDRPVGAAELLAEAPLAKLLLGEGSATPLSEGEREDVLKHRFSYLADDLAVVDWNSAFVLEPSGVGDIPDLLEFATAHLLELRYYDALLDRELSRIYDELDAGGRFQNVFTRRYGRLRRRTAALLLELTEMTERLENAVKIIGDFYLARLWQSAIRRFRLPAWQETVLRKQQLLSGVNALLGDAADTSRGQLMELAVILLILGEFLLALAVH
ncbi:hypothetical protein AMPC_29950 [Anaeromyxobacter paludicola]|uniref:DUF155 domain-containing protein n=1 Tax=Anaeromyxobacter paludicola TaxID=2918171 RepID=A0ABM7XDE0_9BACT|nr:hypothetical protein AMPC_29950 [Anaeromyxobacter paludicola]